MSNSTLCVLSICILHIVFCTVCKYVLSICKLLLLFFCTVWSTLVRISLTKALVLWWCDNKSDLIFFYLSPVCETGLISDKNWLHCRKSGWVEINLVIGCIIAMSASQATVRQIEIQHSTRNTINHQKKWTIFSIYKRRPCVKNCKNKFWVHLTKV